MFDIFPKEHPRGKRRNMTAIADGVLCQDPATVISFSGVFPETSGGGYPQSPHTEFRGGFFHVFSQWRVRVCARAAASAASPCGARAATRSPPLLYQAAGGRPSTPPPPPSLPERAPEKGNPLTPPSLPERGGAGLAGRVFFFFFSAVPGDAPPVGAVAGREAGTPRAPAGGGARRAVGRARRWRWRRRVTLSPAGNLCSSAAPSHRPLRAPAAGGSV